MQSNYYGPPWLLISRKAAVLNSRQSKYPLGNDTWVGATVRAVDYIARNDLTLVTSVGMKTWELPLYLAARDGVKAIVVVPAAVADKPAIAREILVNFRLDETRTGFVFPNLRDGMSKKSGWGQRDFLIIGMADILMPVSLRRESGLKILLGGQTDKDIIDFSVPYEKKNRPRPSYGDKKINPALYDPETIIHFTRSCPGPWPGESEYEYYEAMMASDDEYCHSARQTLARILKTRLILGSHRNLREGRIAVGFADVTPENCRDLFRYRPRLVNPYFEPYGLALTKRVATELGLRPVIYGRPEDYASLPPEERPYFQNRGEYDSRWRIENEWRVPGNICLDNIPQEDIQVLVPADRDVEWMKSRWPGTTISVFKM